jgi:hypothetical protein
LIVFTGVVALLPVLTVLVPPVLEEPEAGVVVAVIGGVDVVFEATCATDEALSFSSMPCERSIMPTFGSGVAVAVSAEAVADELEPDPPPQAARVSVASETRRTLRICAARASFDM